MHDRTQRGYQQTPPPKNNSNEDCGCTDTNTPSEKTINKEREKYCDHLLDAGGAVLQGQNKYKGLQELFDQKKCWFVWSERNYRTYRNLELELGAELIQTVDSIKGNITNYIKLNKKLADGLKKVAASVKDIKAKVTDLREAGCKLRNGMDNSCNCTQMLILGCKTGDCKEQDSTSSSVTLPKECDDVCDKLDKLICMPKALYKDIDYILNSAADVSGIQVFSSIETLDPLQKELSDDAKAFDKLIQDTVKTREGDLKKALDELTATGKDLAKSKVDLYAARSDYEGIYNAVDYFCCPCCDCTPTSEVKCGDPRLEECKKEICEICKEVKDTFCGSSDGEGQSDGEC